MTTFQTMNLPESLHHTLQHMQFTQPTPIQEQAIPPALEGKDILGSAQTGTGKTAAFGIPLVAKLLTDPTSAALVMAPTREIAAQVLGQLQKMLGQKSKIRAALLIGGAPMAKQFQLLRNTPRLVVGTPGRINDHLKRRTLTLSRTAFLVMDEMDRMLDMGFVPQIENVLAQMPQARQSLFFSATFPKNIERLANQYLIDPVRVSVTVTAEPAANIAQDVVHLKEVEKYDRLVQELDARQGSIVVFVKTKFNTEKMAARLAKEGHSTQAIHGDLRQNKRDRIIAAFRNEKHRILVATDVAARGLDIPHIKHVINYDLPQCPEDYIHRIGRTARAGAEGNALNLVAPADKAKWHAITRLLNPGAPQLKVLDGESPRRDKGRPGKKPFKGKPRWAQKPAKGEGRQGPAKAKKFDPRKKKKASV